MLASSDTRRFGVFGHVGNGNLGDESIIAAVVENIRRRYPRGDVCAFTLNPDDTHARHGIPAYPIRWRRTSGGATGAAAPGGRAAGFSGRLRAAARRVPWARSGLRAVARGLLILPRVVAGAGREAAFLARSLRVLRTIDVLVIAGSNQLLDNWGGPWGFPYTLLKWSLLARAAGARVVFLSVGAGPISRPLSRRLHRYALATASYRSYRDEGSRKLVESMGVRRPGPVYPDLAFSLAPVSPPPGPRRSGPGLVVALNPMPFCAPGYWPEHSDAVYGAYVSKLAAFATWLAKEGHRVLLVPTQLRADPPVIGQIRRLVAAGGAPSLLESIREPAVSTFADLLAQIAAADIVAATRFHGIILSYLMHKPVLGIAYHRKSKELMASMGQADYVVDIDEFDVEALIERFNALRSARSAISAHLARVLAGCRRELDEQYDRALAL
jgi:polysaccharide pyruvyl transferase WcaK-like protein